MGMRASILADGESTNHVIARVSLSCNGDMENATEYQTIRVWTRTLKQLRLVAALTGERMVAVMDRLVSAELKRVEQEEGRDRADRP